MRILIATNMYPFEGAPWFGVFVQQQERSLRDLGLEVDLSTHRGKLSRWNYARGILDLVRALRAREYDLIHTHHSYSTVVALLARRLAGRRPPIVFTFHESEIFQRGTDFGQGPLQRLRYSLGIKSWALRRADFLIPVQREMLKICLGEKEADRRRSRVIPAGIDLARFTVEEKRAVRERLGWDRGACYIFFPCDPVKPEKRHDLAEAGFELFARDHPEAKLLVGGRIDYEEMPDYLKASDVILAPTDFEASPTVIKEALACECRVVSTDVGDVKECYGDLEQVFLCDWTAGDIAVKLDEAYRFDGPLRGRARIRELELDLDQVARRLLAVYEEVVEKDRMRG